MRNHIKCPICGDAELEERRRPYYYRGTPEVFKVDACRSCGFWLTNPFPEGEHLAAYYETDDYVSHTDGKGSLMDVVYGTVRNLAIKSKFNLLKKYSVTAQPSLIDYGAGTGEFLGYCKSKGWDVQGFEPSEVARENAKRKGLLLQDPEQKESIQDLSVDFFSLWHVLEHIPDLNESMQYFHSKLKKGGALVIAVPNRESHDAKHYKDDWAAFDVPLHLWHFAKSDIKRLGEKHGFDLVAVRNMPFDSFYVSLLSEKNKTGSARWLQAFIVGLLSNIKGLGKSNMSSLIYVLKKV